MQKKTFLLLLFNSFMIVALFWGACQKESALNQQASSYLEESFHAPNVAEVVGVSERGENQESCAGYIRLTTGVQIQYQYSHYFVWIESQVCPNDPWEFEYSFDETTLNSLGAPVPIQIKHDRTYRISAQNLSDWNSISFQSTIESQNTIQTPLFVAKKNNIVTAVYGQNGNPEAPDRSNCGFEWIFGCSPNSNG